MRSNLYPPAALGHVLAESSEELRALAAWYRHYAEQAGSTVIWDYRLGTAEDLERQASALELPGKRTQQARTAPSQTTAMRRASRASLRGSNCPRRKHDPRGDLVADARQQSSPPLTHDDDRIEQIQVFQERTTARPPLCWCAIEPGESW